MCFVLVFSPWCFSVTRFPWCSPVTHCVHRNLVHSCLWDVVFQMPFAWFDLLLSWFLTSVWTSVYEYGLSQPPTCSLLSWTMAMTAGWSSIKHTLNLCTYVLPLTTAQYICMLTYTHSHTCHCIMTKHMPDTSPYLYCRSCSLMFPGSNPWSHWHSKVCLCSMRCPKAVYIITSKSPKQVSKRV